MSDVDGWVREALALHQAGNVVAAEPLYRKALDAAPTHVDALYLLGMLYLDLERFEPAEQLLRRAVTGKPDHFLAHRMLGLALLEQGRVSQGIACLRRAIELNPDGVESHIDLGAALGRQRNFPEAEAAFRSALELSPDLPEALLNLGLTLREQGRFEEAERALRRMAHLQPRRFPAHNELGKVLHAQGRHEEAAAAYREALRLRPETAETHHNLGVASFALERFEDAIGSYREALRLRPDYASARANLAIAHAEQDDIPKARECYARLGHDAETRRLWELRGATACPTVFDSVAEIDDYRAELTTMLESIRDSGLGADPGTILACGVPPSFNLAFHGRDDRPIKELYGAVFDPCFPKDRPEMGQGPPRVGFVVTHDERAFLRSLGGFFEHRTPGALSCTVVCSAKGIQTIRAALGNADVNFVVLPPDVAGAVATLRAARFDILYYREVGTDVWNYFLPFFRLAPIQCTSFGIQVTSGIPEMDYYLSSRWVEAEDADRHYTETLVRLKTLLVHRRRAPRPSKPPTRSRYGLSDDRHVYLCPQQLGKFHPEFDALLEAILTADPLGDVVITAGAVPAVAQRLQARFLRVMPAVADRIRFVPPQKGADYFGLILGADVLLDPPHFGGMNTTYDTLSLGKAIVTMPSRYHRGRYTLGCYRAMGVDDGVVASPEEYVNRAVRIACDREFRGRVEQRIAGAGAALFENLEAVRELETFFLEACAKAR